MQEQFLQLRFIFQSLKKQLSGYFLDGDHYCFFFLITLIKYFICCLELLVYTAIMKNHANFACDYASVCQVSKLKIFQFVMSTYEG